MTALTSAISSALVHFVWQGVIVGFALWTLLFALKNKSANARYIVSCAALVLLALLPLVSTAILYFEEAPPVLRLAGSGRGQAAEGDATGSAQGNLWASWVQAWALPAWSVGVVLFSFRFFLSCRHVLRLRSYGEPAVGAVVQMVDRLRIGMSVRRRIRVVVSRMSDSPGVVGVLRPVILLPTATLMGLTPLQLEAILAHEIGHIRRYDYLVNMMQMLIETLLFYHPAVWWTSRRIRVERELCCDDIAVRFTGDPVRYARALTAFEKIRVKTPDVVMASAGGPLLYRIRRLVGAPPEQNGGSRLLSAFVASMGVLVFVLNVSWIRAQDAPGVKVDLGASSVIHRSPVVYPDAAKKQGVSGEVQVEVKLDSKGQVSDARVLTGPEELRKPALQSVLDWHFTSDAAQSTRNVTISFSEAEAQTAETAQTLIERDLKARLAAAAAELSKLQVENRRDPLAGPRPMERELERELNKVAQALQGQPGGTQELERAKFELEMLRAQLALAAMNELVARVDAGVAQAGAEPVAPRAGGRGAARFVGRVLQSIATPGMSDSARNELLPRLPVRPGDVVTEGLLEQIGASVRGYDEHLRVQVLSTSDGQAELRISAPN
jgi:TonB family protein